MTLFRILTFFVLTLFVTAEVVYHVSIQGATQSSCKITHRATAKEPYLKVVCEYTCPHPVDGTIDVKTLKENVYCREASPSRPSSAVNLDPTEETQ